MQKFTRKLAIITLWAVLLVLSASIYATPARAATGINGQLNFQGRLLNSQGAVVPDGYYNMEFKIYQDGDGQSVGDATGSPAGSLKWTEDWLNTGSTQGVQVVNGFLSVQLGARAAFGNNVNWNSDTLWLSMQVGNTSNCTISTSFQADCGGDGEMTPMKRLSASPYALNSNALNGLTSGQFLQLAQGVQTDTSAVNPSVFVNKNNSSGTPNIVEIQKAGVDVLTVDNSGSLLLGKAGSSGQNGKLVFNTTNASNTSITIQAASTATSYTLTLPTTGPNTSQCLQSDSTTASQLVFGPCGANGTFLSKNATDTSSASAGTGNLYAFTNSSSGSTGTVLKLDNGNNTGSTLSLTTSGNPGAGNALIYAQDTNATPSGNLIDLQSGNAPTSKFSVNTAGDITNASHIINSDTLSGTALTFGGASAASIQSAASQALNITGHAASTWSLDSGNLTLQTSAGSSSLSIDAGTGANGGTITVGTNATTLSFGTGTANQTISLGGSSGTNTITIGNNSSATNTITVGNTNSSTSVSLQSGPTGAVNIGSVASSNLASTVNIANTSDATSTQTVNIGSAAKAANSLVLEAGNTGTIAIGNGTSAHTINVGNGGTSAQAVNIGSTSSTSKTTILGGVNGANETISLQTAASGVIGIGTINNSDTINIGSTALSTGTQTINIGATNTAGGTANITIGTGSSATGGTTAIQSKGNTTIATNGVTRATFDTSGNLYLGNGTSSPAPLNFSIFGTNSSANGVAGGSLNIQSGNATSGTAAGGTTSVDAGAGTGGGSGGNLNLGTANAAAVNLGNTNASVTSNGNLSTAAGKTFTVSSGATSLTGGTSGAALTVTSGSTTGVGTVIKEVASQTADAWQLQDSTGANLQRIDVAGNVERIGYLDTPYGGLGSYGNLLAQSEAFDNASWTKSNVTAPTADQIVAPDGNTTAESLADSSSGGSVSQTSSTAPTNANYTFSVWLKTASGTQAADLRIDGATTGTGTKATVTATTTWQRFSVTQNTNGFTGNIKVSVFPGGTGGSGTVSAWGAQLVLGSTSQVYTATSGSTTSAATGLAVNGNALFVPAVNSAQAFLVQTASGITMLGIDTNTPAVNLGITGSTAQTSTVNVATSTGAAQTINIGSATNGSASNGTAVLIQGGNGGSAVSIQALAAGTINIGTNNAANTVQIGSASLSSGTQTINIGTNNTSGGTTNITIGTGSSATGGTTAIQSKGNTTLTTNGVLRATLDSLNNLYLGNGSTNASPNNFTIAGTGSTTGGTTGATLSLVGGASTAGNTNGGNLVLQGGTGAGSGVTGSVLVKPNGSDSTTAFQVQNNAGKNVVAVDSSNKQLILGDSNNVNGTLVFKNSTGSNGITINSTSASSNYTLTLPSSAPATGLCIETSPGNANQLVFASCSNNNASIQEVAEWDANNTNQVTVSPGTVGDEMVLTTQIPTSGVSVSSISGGGVTTWNKVVASANNATVHRVEMWVGTVTSTGSSTITVTYSSSPGAEEVTATEFTAAGVNSNTSWGIETSNSQLNSTSSSTVTFPSATAVNGSELYVGYAQVQNPPASAGSTASFNYIVTSTQHNIITYDTDLTANTAYQPTANQNSAGQSNTVDVVLTAFVTSTSINNTTSLQNANFYVQAASAGSVAGVLQAASSGSADIFNLRNSAGVNIATVGNTGATLFKNSTDSSTAFQVQNSSGNSILTVNTSSNNVALGKAGTLGGSLVFNDSGDSNTITINAPSSVAASYILSLPTNTPTAGLCLGTSPSNANQLIFASCATQVSAASISYVNKWSNSGTGVTTISDSPASTGNLLVFFSHTTNNVTVSSISGGGVTNWTKITGNTGVTGGNIEMWRGVVTTTGAGTITVTYSGAAGTNDISAQEFTMGSNSGTWAVDTSGTTNNTSATINYPSLTPAASSELYAGYAWGANTMSAGSTTGYTYLSTSLSKYLAYNTNVTAGSAQQPTATQSASGSYNSVAALIAAYAGTSVIVNSTAVQQANYNIQAATSGTVAGVLQGASSGTADIFQVKDGSGLNVLAVNTSNINGVEGVTLGAAGSVSGQLTFNSSGNTNSITLTAPTAPGASYTLTLPTTTPAPGQCLATSPSNANQLVFSSCANQVTSVAISFVNNWKSSNVTQSPTLSVSPTTVGDLMTLFIYATKGDTVSSVSGGGVSAWTKIVSANSEDMWRGVVTSSGNSTISVSISGAANPTVELAAQEWTTGSTTGSWVVDTSGTINNASSTTVSYPSLTPQSTKDLYVGYAIGTSTMSAGSTSGYTYFAGAGTTIYGARNTSVSTTTQPTASQSSSGTSIAAAALIAAYSSSSVISNSTVTQEANFNIQAATSGSVAGVLQAFPTGTGDIFDLLDGNGTLVGSVGYSGNMLVEPSTSSTTAFQVQNSSAVNVLVVDTQNKRVLIGAGNAGESTPSLLVVDSETGTSADPSGVNGAMYYNATTHTLRCYVDGAWQSCSGLLYANTSNSSSISNCSNACAAFNTAAAVPANYCQTGRVININANGYFSSTASATNLQFGLYYGTDASVASNDTQIGTLPPALSVNSANNNYFQLNFSLICFSTTSMQGEGTLSMQVGSAASGLTAVPLTSTAGTTVVSTSAKNLYIFPIWGTANASNTATLTQLIVNAY